MRAVNEIQPGIESLFDSAYYDHGTAFIKRNKIYLPLVRPRAPLPAAFDRPGVAESADAVASVASASGSSSAGAAGAGAACAGAADGGGFLGVLGGAGVSVPSLRSLPRCPATPRSTSTAGSATLRDNLDVC